jgi:hypothetical protein
MLLLPQRVLCVRVVSVCYFVIEYTCRLHFQMNTGICTSAIVHVLHMRELGRHYTVKGCAVSYPAKPCRTCGLGLAVAVLPFIYTHTPILSLFYSLTRSSLLVMESVALGTSLWGHTKICEEQYKVILSVVFCL